MENLKIIQTLFIAIVCLFGFTACQQDASTVTIENTSKEEIVEILPISDEMQKKLNALKFNNVTYERNYMGNDNYLDVYAYDDMLFSEEQINEMYKLQINNVKQYQTTNQVTGLPRVILVRGTTIGGAALSADMIIGLRRAVKNFNDLALDITFDLRWGLHMLGDDIVVKRIISPVSGGSAGFPSGGDPFSLVRLNSGMDGQGFSRNVFEHLVTHELGHCIGLRHSDWASRLSCGSINPEGAAPSGAIYIPGTAIGFDTNSIMQACFNTAVNGEFNANDITALQYLY